MVAAEHYRQDARSHHLRDRALDGRVRERSICRNYGRVPEVDDLELGERIDPHLNVGTSSEAGAPDSPGAEPGSRPVGNEVVHGRADDSDVHPCEVRRLLGPGQPGVGEEPRVIGLPEAAPASTRVKHAPMLCGTERRA